jgi:hypothetical protein
MIEALVTNFEATIKEDTEESVEQLRLLEPALFLG